jgi:two-component system sensor histidine kinase HydH
MRLNRLVTDLVHYSRPLTLRRALVPVAELGFGAHDLPAANCQVVTKVDAARAVKSLRVDPDLFRRALDSLLENACQAMKQGGLIEVELGAAELNGRQAVRVTVTDKGEGMDAQTLARATAPFFSTRPSGVGLGLSIAQRIVEAHGGVLSLASEPKRGTTVTIIVPDDENEDSTDAAKTGSG